MRATDDSHIFSFRRLSRSECFYFNAARAFAPDYLSKINPDLVIFHNTFIARRFDAEAFERDLRLIDFVKGMQCQKSLVCSDESWRTVQLTAFIRDFDISHVFTFAPPRAVPVI